MCLRFVLVFVARLEKQESHRMISTFNFRHYLHTCFIYETYYSQTSCRGFKLPASHVIHTVGPVYDVDSNAATSLSNAYRYLFLSIKWILFKINPLADLPIFPCLILYSYKTFTDFYIKIVSFVFIPVSGTVFVLQERTILNMLHFLPYPVVSMGESNNLHKVFLTLVVLDYWYKNRWLVIDEK